MFAEAHTIARKFTRPVLGALQRVDDKIGGVTGALVVVNDDGWVVTAAHQIQGFLDVQRQHGEYLELEKRAEAIRTSPEKMSDKERGKRLRRLKMDPGLPKRYAMVWGYAGAQLVDVRVLAEADLAVGRLDPFDPSSVESYPTFKAPAEGLHPGTSLCRLGYPFHDVAPDIDDKGNFIIDRPPPLFPIEGIYSRNVQVGERKGYRLAFLETSSPGLRGQSGGPIFDKHGTVWAIQSQTRHYPLGFSPPVPGGKPSEVEHQFLNVGWGIHPETLSGFFSENDIDFNVSAY